MNAESDIVAPNSLPAETYNLLVVFLTCLFFWWLLRLCRQGLSLQDLRAGRQQRRILAVEGISAYVDSISALTRNHLQQFLRTQRNVPFSRVPRAALPFFVRGTGPKNSLMGKDKAELESLGPEAFALEVELESTVPFFVQAFYGVTSSAVARVQYRGMRGAEGEGGAKRGGRSKYRSHVVKNVTSRLSQPAGYETVDVETGHGAVARAGPDADAGAKAGREDAAEEDGGTGVSALFPAGSYLYKDAPAFFDAGSASMLLRAPAPVAAKMAAAAAAGGGAVDPGVPVGDGIAAVAHRLGLGDPGSTLPFPLCIDAEGESAAEAAAQAQDAEDRARESAGGRPPRRGARRRRRERRYTMALVIGHRTPQAASGRGGGRGGAGGPVADSKMSDGSATGESHGTDGANSRILYHVSLMNLSVPLPVPEKKKKKRKKKRRQGSGSAASGDGGAEEAGAGDAAASAVAGAESDDGAHDARASDTRPAEPASAPGSEVVEEVSSEEEAAEAPAFDAGVPLRLRQAAVVSTLSMVVYKTLLVTPTSGYVLQDVFGLEEREDSDCVVCLTEPKQVVMLPCRHLCVCTECFKHIDKCPVCRSKFDSYLVFDTQGKDGGDGTEDDGSDGAGAGV